MDVVLSSPAVADLMLGECMRRSKDGEDKKPKPQSEGMARCFRLQKILAYAIHNDDLDTMRTCYMIQAYGDLDGPKEGKETNENNETSVPDPSERIITSSSKTMNDLGEGNATNRSAIPPKSPPGQAGIVLQPVPLDSLGQGKAAELKANETKEKLAEGNETQGEEPPIVVEPLVRDELGAAPANETVASPAPAAAAPPSIIVEPIPVKTNETATALVVGRKLRKRVKSKLTTVALLAKAPPALHVA
jgi:hypothetical protein